MGVVGANADDTPTDAEGENYTKIRTEVRCNRVAIVCIYVQKLVPSLKRITPYYSGHTVFSHRTGKPKMSSCSYYLICLDQRETKRDNERLRRQLSSDD